MVGRLIESAEKDSVRRLKWVVCRSIGVSPLSVQARLLTKKAVLRMACNMILDRRGGGIPRPPFANTGFDMERFDRLKGAKP